MTSLRDVLAERRAAAAVHSPIHNADDDSGGNGGNVAGNENNNLSLNSPLSRVGKEELRRRPGAGVEAAVTWMAFHLAEELADPGSVRFFRKVVEAVPLRVVRQALALALELRPDEVRRSRAAYFTALVRPHLAPRRRS